MAYSTQNKYSQSIQFTYNKTPYDSYNTAVRMVTKKNLLPGEPAACFYRNDEGDLKLLLAVGTVHGAESPLILSENDNPAELYTRIEELAEILGSDPVNIIDQGEDLIIHTVTEAANYIYSIIKPTIPVDEIPEQQLPDLGNVTPDSTITDKINILLYTVKNLVDNIENLIVNTPHYEEEDGFTKVYSVDAVNQMFEDFYLHNVNWRSQYTSGSVDLKSSNIPIYIEIDGGEMSI